MSAVGESRVDVLIFGGGGAGLWLLDELHRAGHRVLLAECNALGAGQTVASQGIIHGGLKYTLPGAMTESARAIREMPGVWRGCLAGTLTPHLTDTCVLSECCYLWRTGSLASRVGMIGARAGLRSVTTPVAAADRPAVLASSRGEVVRVDEQVIDPASFLGDLAGQHQTRLVRIDSSGGVEFQTSSPGRVDRVTLVEPGGERRVELTPGHVVFAAGAGNVGLREGVGLSGEAMQRRPLHMVMVRGELPVLYGHCVDGAKTRVTITTARDSRGGNVWQVGGQISEDGVAMTEGDLIGHARSEIAAVLPEVDLAKTQWATYRIDRAEGKTAGGARPAGADAQCEGNVITGWPTKLALVPRLAKLIRDSVGEPSGLDADVDVVPCDWARPKVALPPWETCNQWQ